MSSALRLADYCRMTGHRSIHELSTADMTTTDLALAQNTGIPHAAAYQG